MLRCTSFRRATSQPLKFRQQSLNSVNLFSKTRSINTLSNVTNRSSFQFNHKRFYSSNTNHSVDKLRNFAICAHVDVGKTTLVDSLLQQSGVLEKKQGVERVMDSGDLEKERGITILSKWTALDWKDYRLNIIDTPGHSDFGGEVERVLGMVDSVCLLVDATEGPMPQTKFVLAKALEQGLKPFVVINKFDRDTARIGEVENEVFDLFWALDASEEQLDFPILYASARDGWAVKDPEGERKDMTPLFEAIVENVPHPKVNETTDAFRMLVTTLEYDRIFGKILTGRIESGNIKVNDKLKSLTRTGEQLEEFKVVKLLSRLGLKQTFVDEASVGDVISLAGVNKSSVTDTICDPSWNEPIETKPLDPPIISINVTVNDSPLSGRDGKKVSAILLRERLQKEAQQNVTIRLEQTEEKDAFEIQGKGELQLGVLIETMRREGFEVSVSPPRVLFKTDEDGKKLEPIEEVVVDVDNQYTNSVIEKLNNRRAMMSEFKQYGNKARLIFKCPSRTLVGYRAEFKTDTRGTGVINTVFDSYQPFKGEATKVRKGVLISTTSGAATSYALAGLEPRGKLFISPTEQIYEGMIIGEHSRGQDLEVNPCKSKHLTNVRAAGSDEKIKLSPPKDIILEEAITYVLNDELIEVTPNHIRLRKRLLSANERKKAKRGGGRK
eukprot:gb/GECH01007075.1/.p1 GENE.gb/GECH01007075.1/~~gb/GECH01007075.1/.p1  ORF type:complete len:668 (+),score=145.83 gb/GECH01007075.1/:1-2004(+)